MKYLASILFGLCFAPAWGQNTILSQAEIGTFYTEFPSSIVSTPDGGFIVGGITNAAGGGTFDTPTMNPNWLYPNQFNIFLVKYDSNNSVEWQKSFGGFDGDVNDDSDLGDLIQTSDGGYILFASTALQQDSIGSKNAPTYGLYDFWVVKFDSNFSIEWQNTYGGSGYEGFVGKAIELSDGSFLFAGCSDSPISGTKTESCRGGNDYWLVKTDALGNQLWDKTLGSAKGELFNDMIVLPNGSIILLGTTYSDTVTYTPSGDRTMTYGKDDYWLVSLDSFGNILWDKTLGGPGIEASPLMGCLYFDGISIYVGGNSRKESINPPTMRTAEVKGATDAWIVKLDTSGNILWDKSYGGEPSSLQFISTFIKSSDSDKIIVVSTSTSNAYGDKSEDSRGGVGDYWVFKIDTSGLILWDKTIGGSGNDRASDATVVDSTNLLVCGKSFSPISGDKTTNSEGYSDVWIVKLGESQANIANYSYQDFNIYPNPTNNLFTVQGENMNQLMEISVVDLSGRVVKRQKVSTNATSLSINIENLSRGTYIVRLIGKKQVLSYKLIKN